VAKAIIHTYIYQWHVNECRHSVHCSQYMQSQDELRAFETA